jgi:hypothetical protein
MSHFNLLRSGPIYKLRNINAAPAGGFCVKIGMLRVATERFHHESAAN